MELPGGGGVWLAPSPSLPGPAVPDRHDEHGVGTFIWPPAGTSTWPPVGTFSWPRTVQHVDERPHQVGGDSGEVHPTRARDGVCSADCGHAAFVEVLERRHAGIAIEARPDHL